MISVYDNKESCCGCTACESICPKNAITMIPDEEGFFYPKINQESCIDCGKCKKVCPFQNETEINDSLLSSIAYAVKHKENKIRMRSASGGAYTALSDHTLKNEYVLYGVEYDANFSVRHCRITDPNKRDRCRGSKYPQSNLESIYGMILEDLVNSRNVYFVGTGCQVAGLKNYLTEKKERYVGKLLTTDLVCHGTFSPLLWKEFLKFIQKKNNIKEFIFRYKEKGWHGPNVMVKYTNNKEKVNTAAIKVFGNLFSTDLALRPSCYYCKFANLSRTADITIADFWGIENLMPEIDDDKGISLLLVNSTEGKRLFDSIKGDINYWRRDIQECVQTNLRRPTKMPINRNKFWDDYYAHGFIYVAKKYAEYDYKSRAKKIIRDFLISMKLWDRLIVFKKKRK